MILLLFLLPFLFPTLIDSVYESSTKIKTGADQTAAYLPYLRGKKVAMVVNHTSIIGQKNSVDSLRSLGIQIVKIFSPEHGFRGQLSNGAHVSNGIDTATGIPIISLYGKHVKPTQEDIEGVDLFIFDIQDVGARFYTYIATLHYVMEACAEHHLELIVLDRPNPNGFYVDGPVLEDKFKSFVGMHPVPIVHGMTVAEYAQMINGEGWLHDQIRCRLKIIPLQNYTHATVYELPVYPSPNLNSQRAILLYPSLCLFEGTVISLGRGTYFPFQVLANPKLNKQYHFNFMPISIPGMSEHPLHQNESCYGIDLRQYPLHHIRKKGQLDLRWLLELYKAYPLKPDFFDHKKNKQLADFDRLAGTEKLRAKIIAQKSEKGIRLSWEPALSEYKRMRKQYLLYP